MVAVLRMSGETLDLDACLQWAPNGEFDASWRIGERRLGRPPATSNGFNLQVADDDELKSCVDSAFAMLVRLAEPLKRALNDGASAEIDFSLEVYAPVPTSVAFPPEFLALLSSLGLQLVVSAYPCSGEQE